MAMSLLAVDLVALSMAVCGGFLFWSHINPTIPPIHPSMLLAVGFCLAAFAFLGLYPGLGKTAVEHMRSICYGTTASYLLLIFASFLFKEWWIYSRGGFLFSWLLSIVLAPVGRNFLGTRTWWGVPTMVLGAGETARLVIHTLQTNRSLGYHPVLCLDDDPGKRNCAGIPVAGALSEAVLFATEFRTRHAIVAMPGMQRQKLVRQLQGWSSVFHHIIVIPDLFGVASLWIQPRDLGGVLGFEIRHNLLNPLNRWVKRAVDLLLSAGGLIVSLPFFALIAIWIKAVSRGPILYRQEREGCQGRLIRVLKLRTMYPDAEQTLERHLAANPASRLEWERFCKLKRDPRILPGVGHFLRKTSLDELPQLWNILKGEMSLVGPRPFPAYHNERFLPEFRALRTQVTPGLTGLWQVTSRSDGDLEVQESLDGYYIRNWSLWLDFYVLIRTIRTVIAAHGAY